MFLELLYELISDISPLYFYLSIILSIICAYKIMNFGLNRFLNKHDVSIHDQQLFITRFNQNMIPSGQLFEQQNWLAKKTMRIEAPDDDSDNESFSFLNKFSMKRGGTKCRNILYSLSLKNILGFYSF